MRAPVGGSGRGKRSCSESVITDSDGLVNRAAIPGSQKTIAALVCDKRTKGSASDVRVRRTLLFGCRVLQRLQVWQVVILFVAGGLAEFELFAPYRKGDGPRFVV